MKKPLSLILLAALTLSMTACQTTNIAPENETQATVVESDVSTFTEPETAKEDEVIAAEVTSVTISVENGQGEMVDLELEKNPQRIAVLDYVALDQLVSWGLEDNIVGMVKKSVPSHLSHVAANEDVVNLGTLKEVDMEAIMSLQPDLIFSSGRTRKLYDDLSMIAPTVMTRIDYTVGTVASYEAMALRNAQIFGMEETVKDEIAANAARVKAIADKAAGKTAVVGLMSGGSLKTLGNESRCSIIGTDMGFENVATDVDSTHGNVSSYELLLQLNPDYIFILDRDSAIGTDGASPAEQLMDNEIVHQTDAYQNQRIIYLSSDVWYVSEGGLQSFDIMLTDIESAFE